MLRLLFLKSENVLEIMNFETNVLDLFYTQFIKD